MIHIFPETRMFGLLDGEKIMTLAFFVLIQYRSVTDRRTDGHLCSGYTSACIACYANAPVETAHTTIITKLPHLAAVHGKTTRPQRVGQTRRLINTITNTQTKHGLANMSNLNQPP